MIYPLLSEYVSSMQLAEHNFATLGDLRPVMWNGRPYMSSGNFATVFKMQDITSKKYYAVKCFNKGQARREESYRHITRYLGKVKSDYLVNLRWIDDELFVESRAAGTKTYPVLLMDWVEGQPLDLYCDRGGDAEVLYAKFQQFAYWMLSQPFAHGDIKPDNIVITPTGS